MTAAQKAAAVELVQQLFRTAEEIGDYGANERIGLLEDAASHLMKVCNSLHVALDAL